MKSVVNLGRRWLSSRGASDRTIFALRCTLAACIAYAIADRLWPQLPLWAPVSALTVSQHRWHQTELFVSGLSLGTFVGAVIAVLVTMIGTLLGMPTIAQVGIAVAVAACFAMNWTSARAAMWMALIAVWLIHRFPGEMVTSAGWMMAEQVVLGAVIGGLLAAAFEFGGLNRKVAHPSSKLASRNRRRQS